MSTNATAKTNIANRVSFDFPWRVVNVYPLSNYALAVDFIDGLHGIIEMKELIMSPDAGVFVKLIDKDIFNSVEIYLDGVSWLDHSRIEVIGHGKFPYIYADLAADAMWGEIKKNGTWILQ